MKKHNITKEYLYKKYCIEKLSSYKIANELNIPQCTIFWYLKKYELKTRTISQANKLYKLTEQQCKNRKGKSNSNYLDGRCSKSYHCIERNCNNKITYQGALSGSGRCRSCASRIQNIGRFKGSNHPNWQGGITPLRALIRNLIEYKNWRKEVFKRDDYTCQECDKTKCYVEAHHIKEFHIILAEFLKEYDQFSPMEDKETLVRLAIKYKPFWNIDNGQTLCKDCHNLTKNVRRTQCLKN